MIELVLLDADGVIQRRPDGWRERLVSALGFDGEAELFLRDLYGEESPVHVTRLGISEGLRRVLQRWSCTASLEIALELWTSISVEAGIQEIITDLRARGIQVCLSSNQESFKAAFMSTVLGYGTLFDREFYSCEIGHAKPDRTYFEAIVAAMGIAPARTLFIDDRELNVRSAREVGLVGEHFARLQGATELLRILEAHRLLPGRAPER
jgi:putative hydrolase of the HAD superfamily